VLTTVSIFQALQFNAAKKQFVATRKVPISDVRTHEFNSGNCY